MLLGVLMLSLHCSDSFRECALDRYTRLKEAGREAKESDARRVQCPEIRMPGGYARWESVFPLLAQEHEKRKGRHKRTRIDMCDDHGRIGGRLRCYLYDLCLYR